MIIRELIKEQALVGIDYPWRPVVFCAQTFGSETAQLPLYRVWPIAEAEAKQARESAEWEKNQSRIREYLETLSAPKRSELEIAALMASPLGRGQISLRVRQSIIDAYVLDILEGRSAHE